MTWSPHARHVWNSRVSSLFDQVTFTVQSQGKFTCLLFFFSLLHPRQSPMGRSLDAPTGWVQVIRGPAHFRCDGPEVCSRFVSCSTKPAINAGPFSQNSGEVVSARLVDPSIKITAAKEHVLKLETALAGMEGPEVESVLTRRACSEKSSLARRFCSSVQRGDGGVDGGGATQISRRPWHQDSFPRWQRCEDFILAANSVS